MRSGFSWLAHARTALCKRCVDQEPACHARPAAEGRQPTGMAGGPLFARVRLRVGCRCRSRLSGRPGSFVPLGTDGAASRWRLQRAQRKHVGGRGCCSRVRALPGLGESPPIGVLLATRKCRAEAGSGAHEPWICRRRDCRPVLFAGDSGQDQTAPLVRCKRGHGQRRSMVALPAVKSVVPHRGRGARRVSR